jgi:hypothetical protein
MAVTSLAFDHKCLSEATLNHMKSRLMMALELGADSSPSLDYAVALERLVSFPQYALDGGKNKWVRAASERGANQDYESIVFRCAEISRFWFTPQERMEVAMLLIQRHDQKNQFHCDTIMCGEECEYAIIVCANDNCGILTSRKWTSKHDEVCVHKQVPCSRACGDVVARRLMAMHLADDCDLRPAQCLYSDIGCKAGTLPPPLASHIHTTLWANS